MHVEKCIYSSPQECPVYHQKQSDHFVDSSETSSHLLLTVFQYYQFDLISF